MIFALRAPTTERSGYRALRGSGCAPALSPHGRAQRPVGRGCGTTPRSPLDLRRALRLWCLASSQWPCWAANLSPHPHEGPGLDEEGESEGQATVRRLLRPVEMRL